jgi:integrase
MKLTDRQIKALKPLSTRFEVWEDNGKGFGVRVSPAGRKSFIYMYRFQGNSRRMTLGVYPEMSLANAHASHATARQLLDKGQDPGTVEQDKKEASQRSPSVKRLVEEYIEKYAKVRKRSWKEDERILHKDVIPRWGNRKAKDVTRRDIILLLDEIVERGASIQANRTLAAIRKMYSFAMGRGVLDASPCVAIPAPSEENMRNRVLTKEEIKIFWDNLDTAKMEKATGLVLKLQLVTAQRKGEVASAKWTDFDLNLGWWTIPAEESKNKKPNRIPMTPLASQLLKEIKTLSGESIWLFPSPREGQHIAETSIDHAVRENSEHFGIDHFTPHDLRRTASTEMASMGIDDNTIDKILNHIPAKLKKTYNLYSYDLEKKKALRKWDKELQSILNDQPAKSNVVHL